MPMHVAALAIVEGAALHNESGRLQMETIREHVERRTHLAPRLRQRLRRTSFAAGPPIWVDDPAFDIANHVRTRDLSYPTDEASILQACTELNEAPLDRSRPLWEMWVLTGRGDGNVALLIRMHHVVADGIAALNMLACCSTVTPSGRNHSPRMKVRAPCRKYGTCTPITCADRVPPCREPYHSCAGQRQLVGTSLRG